jgi:hypothetical protein
MLSGLSAEFFAGLNPLETLRRYLNDRARRRRLKEREPLEQQRLQLENMKLVNEVMLARLEIIRIARSMEISDQSVAAAMGIMDSLALPEPGQRSLPSAEHCDPPPSAPEQDDGTESGA